jgi:hypothetical protein
VILLNILQEKKCDVQKLIDDLFAILSNYTLVSMSQRDAISHEKLQVKQQTFFSLFSLLICSNLFEIMIKHINIKIDLKKVKVSRYSRS